MKFYFSIVTLILCAALFVSCAKKGPNDVSTQMSNSDSSSIVSQKDAATEDATSNDSETKHNVTDGDATDNSKSEAIKNVVNPDIQGEIKSVNLNEDSFVISAIETGTVGGFDMVLPNGNETVVEFNDSTSFVYTTSDNVAKTTQYFAGSKDDLSAARYAKISGSVQNAIWVASVVEVIETVSEVP